MQPLSPALPASISPATGLRITKKIPVSEVVSLAPPVRTSLHTYLHVLSKSSQDEALN